MPKVVEVVVDLRYLEVVPKTEVWRSEAHYRRVDYGFLELRKRGAGVQTWNHRGMELWSSRGAL